MCLVYHLPLVMLHTIALLLPILAPKLGFFRVMMKFFGPWNKERPFMYIWIPKYYIVYFVFPFYMKKTSHYIWSNDRTKVYRLCTWCTYWLTKMCKQLCHWVLVGWLCWGLTSQSTIFQSYRDGAIASWVINQYFRGVKCLAQGHNTAAVGLEPRTSRSGVRHSTTEPPRSPPLSVTRVPFKVNIRFHTL